MRKLVLLDDGKDFHFGVVRLPEHLHDAPLKRAHPGRVRGDLGKNDLPRARLGSPTGGPGGHEEVAAELRIVRDDTSPLPGRLEAADDLGDATLHDAGDTPFPFSITTRGNHLGVHDVAVHIFGEVSGRDEEVIAPVLRHHETVAVAVHGEFAAHRATRSRHGINTPRKLGDLPCFNQVIELIVQVFPLVTGDVEGLEHLPVRHRLPLAQQPHDRVLAFAHI